MDIAVLGAVIDPRGAVEGAAVATRAAEGMGRGMRAAEQTTQAASANSAAAFRRMGTEANTAGQSVQRSSTAAFQAVQRMGEEVTRGATQTAQAVQRMGQQVTTGATQAARAVQQVAAPGTWDRIRSQAAAVATSVTGSFDQMRRSAATFATGARASVGNAFSSFRAGISNIGAARSQIVDLANVSGLLNNPLGAAVSRFDSFSRILGGLPAAVGPVLTVLGLLAAALLAVGTAIGTTYAAMQAAGPIQAARLGLETVTGSAEQADAVLNALRENAKKTGADIQGSLDTSLKFIGLGFSPADAVKLNTSIQDIAGTLGMSTARANELGNALAQVQSKGVVSMEELRQQIAEKGVPVFEELSKKLKVSQGDLIKMVSEGKVRSKELIDIFLNLEGGFAKFQGGAQRAAATLPGALARMKANWNDLLVTMGTPVNEAVTPILNHLADKFGELTGSAATLGESIAAGITAITPAITATIDEITGKIQGLLAMFNSDAGLGEAWARNIWATFVDYGLSAVERITAGFATIGQLLARFMADAVETLAIATTPEFWGMIGSTLVSIAIDFENGLRAAAETFVNAILGALPDWMGGKGPKLDLGRVANPTIPGPAITKPDLFSDNNSPLDIGAMFNANVDSMKSALDGTRTYWQGWAQDWNNLNLKPVAEKIAPKTALSTKGSTGGAPDALEKMKKGASEADKLARQMEASAKRYIEATKTPLEKYAATVNEINMLQARGLLTVDQAARASAQALETLNEGTRRAAEKAATPLGKLMLQWGDLKKQIQDVNAGIAETFADGMSNAVNSLITGSATASEAFAQMAQSIISDITKMITKLLIQWAIQQAIGMVSGTGGNIQTFTASTAAAQAGVSVMHGGGTVGGHGGATRTVSAHSFAGAPRFHGGGTVPGVSGGETPIVAEPGEQVLTRDQAGDIKQRLGKAGKASEQPRSQAVNIVNVVDPGMVRDVLARDPSIIINVLSSNAAKVKRTLSLA